MVTNRAGREYAVAAATTSKASLNLSQAPNVPGRLGLYSLPYRGTAVSFFSPLSITDKDNRHAGVLGPSRETKYLLKDHLDATSDITCAPLTLRGLGLPLHAEALPLPFQRSPVQRRSEMYPIYALFWQLHSFALLGYTPVLGRSLGIKHHAILKQMAWASHLKHIFTSLFFSLAFICLQAKVVGPVIWIILNITWAIDVKRGDKSKI